MRTEIIEIKVRVRITYSKDLGSVRKDAIKEALKLVKQASYYSTNGSSAVPLTSKYIPKSRR